jgi:transposase
MRVVSLTTKETTMRKPRQKIDAALKAKIALEAVREQATVADLAQKYQVHVTQIYAWKRQLQENASRVFDAKTGAEDEAVHEQEVEKLHAAIGKLTVERDPRLREDKLFVQESLSLA